MSDNNHAPLWPFYVFPLGGIAIGGLLGLITWLAIGMRCAPGYVGAAACPLTPAQATWLLMFEFVGLPVIAIGLALAGYVLARRMARPGDAAAEGQAAIDEVLRRAREE